MTPATVRRLGADVGVLSLAPADDLEAIERAPDIIVVEAKAFCSASAWFGGASSIAFDRMASALELLRHTRDAGIPSVLIENAPRQTLVNLSDLMEACDIVLSPGSDFPPALFPGVQLASFNPMNLGERGFTTPVFVWDGRASNEREVTELGKILKAVNERCSIDVVAEQAATIGAVMPARIMPEGASCHGVPGQALPVLYRSRAVALASNWASTSSPREMDVRALEQLACGARVVVPRSAYAPLEGLSEASAAEEVGMLVCDLAAASVRSRSDIQAGLRSLYGTMTSWDVARHVFQLCGLEDRLPSRRAVTLVAAVSSSDDVQRLVEGVRGQSIAPDRIHLAVGGDCVDNLAALAALSTPVSTVCVSEPERVDLGLLAADASTALVWIWSDLTSDPGSTLLADMLVARDCSGSDVVGRNGGWFTFTNGISPAHLLADRSLFDVPGTATVDVDGWARRGVRLFSIGPSRGGAA